VEIITSEDAALAHDLALEAWGERVRAAGMRVCQWLNAASDEAAYRCGAPR
jgi:hypothetical protein